MWHFWEYACLIRNVHACVGVYAHARDCPGVSVKVIRSVHESQQENDTDKNQYLSITLATLLVTTSDRAAVIAARADTTLVYTVLLNF